MWRYGLGSWSRNLSVKFALFWKKELPNWKKNYHFDPKFELLKQYETVVAPQIRPISRNRYEVSSRQGQNVLFAIVLLKIVFFFQIKNVNIDLLFEEFQKLLIFGGVELSTKMGSIFELTQRTEFQNNLRIHFLTSAIIFWYSVTLCVW